MMFMQSVVCACMRKGTAASGMLLSEAGPVLYTSPSSIRHAVTRYCSAALMVDGCTLLEM